MHSKGETNGPDRGHLSAELASHTFVTGADAREDGLLELARLGRAGRKPLQV
jgi:hypothetical protein